MMPCIPVDTAVQLIVGPLIDDTDFKSLEIGVAYDAPGMSVDLIKSSISGTPTKVDLNLTTGSTQDWVELGNGMYYIEITAAQNDTEGELQLVGVATGIMPFISAKYQVVPSAVYSSLVSGAGSWVAQLEKSAGQIISGTATGSYTTTTLAASGLASTADDHWNGRIIIFTSGALAGQATDITDYVDSTRTFTFTAITSAPSGNTFIIV